MCVTIGAGLGQRWAVHVPIVGGPGNGRGSGRHDSQEGRGACPDKNQGRMTDEGNGGRPVFGPGGYMDGDGGDDSGSGSELVAGTRFSTSKSFNPL